MPLLLESGELSQATDWTLIDADFSGALPEGALLVPLKYWLTNQNDLASRTDVGVWFAPDDEPEQLGTACATLPVIAVQFPVFTDGRGYSIARLLRERYGFGKELRAIGDVLVDQVFFMKRCGFSSFDLREDQSAEDAREALQAFTVTYQAATDEPAPLFRRRSA